LTHEPLNGSMKRWSLGATAKFVQRRSYKFYGMQSTF